MNFQGHDGHLQAELCKGSFASGHHYFLPIGEILFCSASGDRKETILALDSSKILAWQKPTFWLNKEVNMLR